MRFPLLKSARLSRRVRILAAPVLALGVLGLLLLLYKSMLLVIGPAMKPGTIRMLTWINYNARVPLLILLVLALLPLGWRRGGRSLWRRVVSIPVNTLVVVQKTFLLLVALLVLLLSPFGLLHLAKALVVPGREVFQEKCSACHAARRPMDFLKPEMGWERTVRRMAGKQPGWISGGEQEVIVRYLQSMRSHTDRQLFLLKCRRCHPCRDLFETARSPEQWDRLVDRVWWEDPIWLDAGQAEQIKRYIRGRVGASAADAATVSPPGGDAALQELFEIKCGRCHYLSICLEPDIPAEDWGPILRRMSEKCPDYLPLEEAAALHDWLLGEIQDPEAFRRRYPHIDPMGIRTGAGGGGR